MGFFNTRQESSIWPQKKFHSSVPSVGKLADTAFSRAIRLRFNAKGSRHPESPGSVCSQGDSDYGAPPPVPRKSEYEQRTSDHREATIKRMSMVAENPVPASKGNASVTLAQQLNDLAAANGEGLLSDDEYRLARQNLFHTFSAASEQPTEAPVVKSLDQDLRRRSILADSNPSSAQLPIRTPSLKSRTSLGSSMSNLFQRRKQDSITHVLSDHDQTSLLSSPIHGRSMFSSSRTVKRQGSNSSLTTARSNHIPHDLRSVSSKRSLKSLKSAVTSSDYDGPVRSTTRSLRGEPPPSAFHASHHALPVSSWSKDPESSRSAAEIRAEIAQTELEEQTVLAALSGSNPPLMLVRTLSKPSQPYASRRRSRLGSQESSVENQLTARALRNHNAALNSGHLASRAPSLPDHGLSPELDYRQVEIAERYRQRLDYLRARLKGAELHERLIRK